MHTYPIFGAILGISLLAHGPADAAILTTSQTIPDPVLDPFFPFIGSFDILDGGETFTDTFTARFDPFDSSLGTLIGARLSFATQIAAIGNVMSDDPAPFSYQVSLTTRLDSLAFSSSVIAQDSALIPEPTLPDTVFDTTISTSTGLSGGVDATDLTAFMGPAPVLVTLMNGYDFSGSNVVYSVFADQTAALTITYTYDDSPPPVVPLPAGGLLLLTGLGAFASLRRR